MNGLCVQNKNKITHNTNGFNEMKKKKYVAPTSEVFPMMEELLVQKTSVMMDAPHSEEEQWGGDEEIDGGETEG